MKELINKYQLKLNKVQTDFTRYLLEEINWEHRLIAVKGARGVGKTTMLWQALKLGKLDASQSLFVAMDDLYFSGSRLYDLAQQFVQMGGKHLLLDEVHKYNDWSQEIKLIYDDFSELQVVFTSSSVLEIYGAKADLSRRVVSYTLNELSLREFVLLQKGIELPKLDLPQLLIAHNEIALSIVKDYKPLVFLKDYYKYGAYPYFIEGTDVYLDKLFEVINLVVDIDINAVEKFDFPTLTKIKRLIFAIATSVPFTPNVTKLAERLQISRVVLLKAIHSLSKARVINGLYKSNTGVSSLTKPQKIYLNNTNQIYAIANANADIGNIRETFFVNQLHATHQINLAKEGDFLVDGMFIFEVGGKNKTQKQIAHLKNAYLVKDDIEIGYENSIPLWMFGLLY